MSRLVIDLREPPRSQALVLGLAGVAIVLVAWEAVARLGVGGSALLAPSEIIVAATSESVTRSIGRSYLVTLQSVGIGYLCGLVIGLAMAFLAQTASWMNSLMQRISILGWVLPVVALTPVLMPFIDGNTVPAIVSTWFAYFYVFVGASSGLQEHRQAQADLLRSLGGTRFDLFARVRIPSALPLLVDGMRLAAPAAVTGTVFGEWFGASRGVGVLLVSSMQNMQTGQMWATACVVVATALVFGQLIGLLQRFVARRYA